MKKIILGLTGEIASGKGTAAKYIEIKYQGSSHRFSTPLRDVLDRLHLKQSRENLQKFSTLIRQAFGEDILAKIIFHDTKKDKKEIVVVDGVRRKKDLKYLQKLAYFKLVYIDATLENRYKRLVKRLENPDDQNKTLTEFKKEQMQESESQIRNLKLIADFVVDNNGSVEKFYAQIDKIIKKCQN